MKDLKNQDFTAKRSDTNLLRKPDNNKHNQQNCRQDIKQRPVAKDLLTSLTGCLQQHNRPLSGGSLSFKLCMTSISSWALVRKQRKQLCRIPFCSKGRKPATPRMPHQPSNHSGLMRWVVLDYSFLTNKMVFHLMGALKYVVNILGKK